MKLAFEVIHASMDTIQPQESWDNNYSTTTLGILPSPLTSLNNAFQKPTTLVENQFVSSTDRRNDHLSELVEHISKQLIDDEPNSLIVSTESTSFVPSLNYDYLRPQKIARRTHGDTGSNELLQNGLDQLLTQNGGNKGLSRVAEQGLTLLSLLFECAVAISVDNLGEAHRILLELTQMVSPYSPSCAERVVAYFAKAMLSRVMNSWLGICFPLLNYKSVHDAFQVFNSISPFIKFSHFTSNQAILEAFHRRDRVHIVDLDIMQGLQWPTFFHILATRIEGPPHVRMTGFGTSMEILAETGKQLCSFAQRLGIPFEFHPMATKFSEINASMVQTRRRETLAIHWLQHSLYDPTGCDLKTIRLIQELRPKVFTMVEQDMFLGGSFLDRFVSSLHYYSTIFDSLGAYLASDDPNRYKVENWLLYREINNILAIGGPSRSGEEKLRYRRSEMRKCLMQVSMSANSMAQAQLILNMFPPALGYSLVQGDYGTLRLGWKETSLYTASAWTCSSIVR